MEKPLEDAVTPTALTWRPDAPPQRQEPGVDARWVPDKAEREEEADFRGLNPVVVALFAFPALLAELTGNQICAFQQMMLIWVHEAGHPFWYVLSLGSEFMGAFGGTFMELLFGLIPAAYLFRRRGSYPAACAMLLSCALSVHHAGLYMESADNPHGTGFLGIPLTASSHDWSVILGALGLRGGAPLLAYDTIHIGHAASVVLAFSSVIGLALYLLGWTADNPVEVVSPPAFAAIAYLAFAGAPAVEFATAAAFAAPTLWVVMRRAKVNTAAAVI
jgi:hypothetical protein